MAVESVPKQARKLKDELILARGEFTGHAQRAGGRCDRRPKSKPYQTWGGARKGSGSGNTKSRLEYHLPDHEERPNERRGTTCIRQLIK